MDSLSKKLISGIFYSYFFYNRYIYEWRNKTKQSLNAAFTSFKVNIKKLKFIWNFLPLGVLLFIIGNARGARANTKEWKGLGHDLLTLHKVHFPQLIFFSTSVAHPSEYTVLISPYYRWPWQLDYCSKESTMKYQDLPLVVCLLTFCFHYK